MKILTTRQYKLDKGKKTGVATVGINLAPAHEARDFTGEPIPTMCPMAGWCATGCLNKAGMNQMATHLPARVERTLCWVNEPDRFLDLASAELQRHVRWCDRNGYTPACRPNLLSDQPAIAHALATRFPEVQFYDYTKLGKPWTRLLPNYHLTYSYSERTPRGQVDACLRNGINVAVVWGSLSRRNEPIPRELFGYPTLDGDLNDLRYLDPEGHVVVLRWKGSFARMQDAINAGFCLPKK